MESGAPGSQPLSARSLPSLPVGELEHDVRRRRPPALSFLLRMDTVRRLTRIVLLLSLDALGVYAAILGALELKSALRGGASFAENASQAYHYATFSFILMALLFARSGLYADRASRPGLRAVVSSLFWVTVVAILYAKVDGQEFSSYYIFWGSLVFGVVIVSALRWGYDKVSGVLLRAAGYHRRAALVGTGQHIEAVAHALAAAPGSVSPIDVIGFISLTPRPDNGLRSLGQLDDLRAIIEREQLDEVIIADPAFPQQEAVELVDECHRRGVRVRIAPSTMEILVHRAEFVPGEAVPLFELRSPVFEGFDWFVKRLFDVVGSVGLLMVLSPVFALMALAVKLTSRGPVLYHSMRPGIGGVPFACLKMRTMYEGSDDRQAGLERHNEADGALFKMRDDPRVTPVGAHPAPLLARRAAAAVERRARRDVARRPAPAAPARLRPARGLAPQALPRAARASPACGRCRGARSSTSTTSCGSTSSTSSTGRSPSTSRSSSRRSRRCSCAGAPSERIGRGQAR